MRLSGSDECFDLHQSLTWPNNRGRGQGTLQTADKNSEFWWGKSTQSTSVTSTTSHPNQVTEVSKDGNQKNQADFSGILTRVHLTGPLQCQNTLLLWLPEKRLSEEGKITFFPSYSLQIMVGGRKTCLAFFHTSPSLCKLTAHHKSISAWRKSISRLPFFSFQKKRENFQSSCREGKSNRIRKEGRRSEGGSSKRIIHPLFGQQLCPNEVWQATTEVFR